VAKAYAAIAEAEGPRFADAKSAIAKSYEAGVTDEFVIPSVIGGYAGVRDGDALLFGNFRPDRAREISTALLDPKTGPVALRAGSFVRAQPAAALHPHLPAQGADRKEKIRRVDVGEIFRSLVRPLHAHLVLVLVSAFAFFLIACRVGRVREPLLAASGLLAYSTVSWSLAELTWVTPQEALAAVFAGACALVYFHWRHNRNSPNNALHATREDARA